MFVLWRQCKGKWKLLNEVHTRNVLCSCELCLQAILFNHCFIQLAYREYCFTDIFRFLQLYEYFKFTFLYSIDTTLFCNTYDLKVNKINFNTISKKTQRRDYISSYIIFFSFCSYSSCLGSHSNSRICTSLISCSHWSSVNYTNRCI